MKAHVPEQTPAAVKREVWKRDEGRCAFVGRQGRCGERHRLEFHHIEPFTAGGTSTVTNIELRCRAHNAYEAEAFETSNYERRTPKVGSRSRAFEAPPTVGADAVAAARARAASGDLARRNRRSVAGLAPGRAAPHQSRPNECSWSVSA